MVFIIQKKNWLQQSWIDNKKGVYFIECDLEYSKELHYLHNDFPVAPEKRFVKYNWLSPFCKNLKEKIG